MWRLSTGYPTFTSGRGAVGIAYLERTNSCCFPESFDRSVSFDASTEMISSVSIVPGAGIGPELDSYRHVSVLPDTDHVPPVCRNGFPSTVELPLNRMF